MNNPISNLSAIIVGHVFTSGPGQDLEKFLKTKTKNLMFIGHPFSFSGINQSFFRIYKNKSFVGEYKIGFSRSSIGKFFFLDIFITIALVIKQRKRFDIFIGADNLNAFTGLLLRKMGLVNSVIFYVIDYIPNRFNNSILNGIYHWIDRVCVIHSDYVWNLSSWMIDERERKGISKRMSAPQLIVPIGTNFSKIKRLDVKEINRNTLAYLGHLKKEFGVQLIIEAFENIVKIIPNIKLVIIGKGEYKKVLEQMVEKAGLNENITFLGEVKDNSDVEQILSKCAIGLAPYTPEFGGVKRYTDPGKIKTYMACGLPVIMTTATRTAYEIRKRKAGIAIKYDLTLLINAITTLLNDDELYLEYRKNAIQFGSEYNWDTIFNNAFSPLLLKNK